jgi:hypothetical protein
MEESLAKLNAILAPHHEREYRDLPETYPILYVVGAPRSGTTLLSQLLSCHTNLGYINNLIAAFWQAPLYGIRLSRKLVPAPAPSSFQSEFGRTRGIHEPHEFGYFWSSLLGYEDLMQKDEAAERAIDWSRVRLVLANISHEFGGPVVFKYVPLGWHIAKMQEVLPKSCFVIVRRDPTLNAISLLKMRKQFLGSVERWASLKPLEYAQLKEQPYWRQVAGQVWYLDKSMAEQIERVGGRNCVDVTYENLCREPKRVLLAIRQLLKANGSEVDIVGTPPDSFAVSARTGETHEDFGMVKAAIESFYGRKA